MSRVAMFVTNPCTHDARVMKEAETLAASGYQVCVFALANSSNPAGVFSQGNYTVQRLEFANIFHRVRNSLLFVPKMAFRKLKAVTRLTVKVAFTILSFTAGVLLFVISFGKYQPRSFYPFQNLFGETGVNPKANSNIHIWSRLKRIGVVQLIRVRTAISDADLNPAITKSARKIFRIVRLISRVPKTLFVMLVKVKKRLKKLFNRITYSVLLPFHKISTYYFFCRSASEKAIAWRAEIVHAHDLNTLYAAKMVKDRIGAKFVYDSHELWIHRNRVNRKATMEKLLDRIVEKKLINVSDAIITVCDSIGQWLETTYDNIPKPFILRNMPLALTDQNLDGTPELPERLNLPDSHKVMIYTGKITTGRGIEIGLDIIKENSNLVFVLLGYGEESYMSKIRRDIEIARIGNRVIFCDPVPYSEVPGFIKGADFALVYIEPICLSYEYALPNKLFESIQAGIPVLASNLVEIRKVVESNQVGMCFDNATDLNMKIQALEGFQIAKWKDNIERCKQTLCWEEEQKVLISAYQDLID